MIKAMIHLIVDPNPLPSFEDKVCAAIDVYEGSNRTSESYRINYEDLTAAEQQQWDDFVTMISTKQPNG